MESAKRRSELLYGLRRTREDTVHIDVTHLIEAVGLEISERLIKNMSGMVAATRPAYSTTEVIVRNGNCTVDREDCIMEIERRMITEAKLSIERRTGR